MRYQSVILADGPVAYWRLGESGNARIAVDQAGALAPNLCPNPSMENDIAGWVQTINQNNPGAVLSGTGAQSYVGYSSLQIATTASPSYQGTEIALPGTFSAAKPYTLSLYMKGAAGGEAVAWLLGVAGDLATVGATLTTSWTRYSLTWTPARDRTGVTVALQHTAASAVTFFADAVQVTQTAAAVPYYEGNGGNDLEYVGSFKPNLLSAAAASFEDGTTGGWLSSAQGPIAAASTIANSTARAVYGGRSLAVTTTGTTGQGASIGLSSAASSGIPYTGSVYVWTAASQAVFVSMEDNILGNGIATINQTVPASTWTRLSVTWTPTANSSNARAYVYLPASAPAQTFYVDAAQVTQNPNPVTYSDGQGVTFGQSGPLAGDTATSTLFDGQAACANGTVRAANPTAAITLEAWVYPTSLGTGGIVSKFAASTGPLLLMAGGQAGLWIDGTNHVYTGASLAQNAWSHVAGTYDGTTIRIYVNGALAASQAYAGAVQSNSADPWSVAVYNNSSFFPGRVQEAAVYGYALTARQVASHYAAGPGGYSLLPDPGGWRLVRGGAYTVQVYDSYFAARDALAQAQADVAAGGEPLSC